MLQYVLLSQLEQPLIALEQFTHKLSFKTKGASQDVQLYSFSITSTSHVRQLLILELQVTQVLSTVKKYPLRHEEQSVSLVHW